MIRVAVRIILERVRIFMENAKETIYRDPISYLPS